MTIPDILALDFDGVCCDGLREYFEASRRAHARVWPRAPMPGEERFPAFSALRPVILSGWEMPVLLRAIVAGGSHAEILAGWERVREEMTAAEPPPAGALISRLGRALDEARREWIAAYPAGWAAAHGRRPRLVFVEDRLETLQHVSRHPDLDDVARYLAAWGYNTEAARATARADARIRLLTLEQFRRGVAVWP